MTTFIDTPAAQPEGQTQSCRSPAEPDTRYLLRWPCQPGTALNPVNEAAASPPARRNPQILVLVHGISRQAQLLIDSFAAVADQHNLLLLAPVFDRENYPHYQQLGLRAGERRADLRLLRLLKEVGRIHRVGTDSVHLFGYSGGAQFCQRFALLNPHRVRSLILGAPGWYSLPDEQLSYPYGIGPSPSRPAWRPKLQPFLKIPGLVVIGGADTRRNRSLNRHRKIDRLQGKNRLQRAKNWLQQVEALQHTPGEPPTSSLMVAPNIGHSAANLLTNAALQRCMADFLCQHAEPAKTARSLGKKDALTVTDQQLQRLHSTMRALLRYQHDGDEEDDLSAFDCAPPSDWNRQDILPTLKERLCDDPPLLIPRNSGRWPYEQPTIT